MRGENPWARIEVALGRVLGSTKKLTDAQYAASCVLNDARDGLAVFLTAGDR